jgi:hypothetical protein
LTPCGDGRYCCGETTGCCSGDDAFEIPVQESVVEGAAHDYTTYKNATIGLAVAFGVVALAALLGTFWLLRKNKSLKAQQQQASASAMEETQRHNTNVDPYLQGQEDMARTDATSMSSPHTAHHVYSKPPMSPPLPEVDSNPQRYSELDATATTASPNISYSGAMSPRFDSPAHDQPYDMHR